MAKFLDGELTRLVRDVVKEQIPREQRRSLRRPRRSGAKGRLRS
jgi:hypothetical protein